MLKAKQVVIQLQLKKKKDIIIYTHIYIFISKKVNNNNTKNSCIYFVKYIMCVTRNVKVNVQSSSSCDDINSMLANN